MPLDNAASQAKSGQASSVPQRQSPATESHARLFRACSIAASTSGNF
jgi:hypothetical protein